MAVVGKALPHESAAGHVTGDALYTADLTDRHPNALYAWPVCAPHAHARVISIDSSEAMGSPGVIHVLTGDDVPGEANSGSNRHDEPMFPAEVMHHLQPVAWVLAESPHEARKGAAKVRVSYEPLPAILTIDAAIEQASFLTSELRLADGDMSRLESSALRFDGELRIGGQEHFYLETQASIAWVDEACVSR
jgi:xanthine dehydrogenase large subunit